MTESFIFRFTPSVMVPEALEAIFVQREEIVRRILDLTRESALTSSKHHTLLIGPRGIGKTHGVSLIYHRVKAIEDLREKLLIAWMREEEWGITSLLDLIMRIFRALAAEYKDAGLDERVEALYSLPADHIETAAGKVLKEYVGDRTLLVLIENLDDIFQGLGDEGQKRLRAYIQENPFLTIVATAQSLFNGVSLQTSPFYGFFRIQHLEGLSFEESTQLLASIARYRNDQALESFIQTPMGRARIRAVNHLAGGNHRVYVIFSQFLTRESLDELVEPFMRMLDDLTPYYQDRMRWLSPQQRKIVEFLLNHRSPATVKEIAQRCFMTHQTGSSQLKSLREMEYVQADSLGRESYYELREPLMRLCVEVKKSRGEPIGLFIDFLRLWYSKDELQQRLEFLQPEAALEREYVRYALKAIEDESEDPRVATCIRDYKRNVSIGDFAKALEITEELRAITTGADVWEFRSHCLVILDRNEEALESAEIGLKMEPEHPYLLVIKALALTGLDRYREALPPLDRAIELEPTEKTVWVVRARVLQVLGRSGEALASFDEAIKLGGNDANIWIDRGRVLEALNRYEEALQSYADAIDLARDEKPTDLQRMSILTRLKRYDEAMILSDRLAESEEANALLWRNRGALFVCLDRYEEALAALNKALVLDPSDGWSWEGQGYLLSRQNRNEKALESFDEAIKLGIQSTGVYQGRSLVLLSLARWENAFAALDDLLERTSNNSKHVDNHSVEVVRRIFSSTRNPMDWKTHVASLIVIYDKRQLDAALGVSLAEAISELDSEMVSGATARAWRDVWQELAGDRAEFQLPLRLLDVAVRYRETKDKRVLLELPIEERKLLGQVFNLEEQAES